MMKRLLLIFLMLLPISAFATTRNATNCTTLEIQSKINASSNGDTVQLPTCTTEVWTDGITVAVGITINGNGVSNTKITLNGAEASTVITKQASPNAIRITNLTFITDVNSNLFPVQLAGAWTGTYPIVFNTVNFDIYIHPPINIVTPGGVIFSNVHVNILSGAQPGLFTVKDPTDAAGSWAANATMGTADTSGLLNIYFEDSTMYGGGNGLTDCDDGCRIVIRYNTFTMGSPFNSHGYDTSAWGVRHFEIYENTTTDLDYDNPLGCDVHPSYCIGNINQLVWIRGGTGVVYNNTMGNVSNTTWGDKPQIQISGRAYGQPTLIGKTCGTLVYPEPRQPGQDWVSPGGQYTDPIYFWGNTGTWGRAETDGFGNGWNDCSNPWSMWFNWGTDAINQSISGGSAKPGYTAFTYPHPLASAATCTTPDHLAFILQPSNVNVNTALGSVSVGVYDSGNILCTSDTSIVTIANKGGTCSGMTLGGIKSATVTSGVFTTTDLTEDVAGACTLHATDGALTAADSNSFTISASASFGGAARGRVRR